MTDVKNAAPVPATATTVNPFGERMVVPGGTPFSVLNSSPLMKVAPVGTISVGAPIGAPGLSSVPFQGPAPITSLQGAPPVGAPAGVVSVTQADGPPQLDPNARLIGTFEDPTTGAVIERYEVPKRMMQPVQQVEYETREEIQYIDSMEQETQVVQVPAQRMVPKQVVHTIMVPEQYMETKTIVVPKPMQEAVKHQIQIPKVKMGQAIFEQAEIVEYERPRIVHQVIEHRIPGKIQVKVTPQEHKGIEWSGYMEQTGAAQIVSSTPLGKVPKEGGLTSTQMYVTQQYLASTPGIAPQTISSTPAPSGSAAPPTVPATVSYAAVPQGVYGTQTFLAPQQAGTQTFLAPQQAGTQTFLAPQQPPSAQTYVRVASLPAASPPGVIAPQQYGTIQRVAVPAGYAPAGYAPAGYAQGGYAIMPQGALSSVPVGYPGFAAPYGLVSRPPPGAPAPAPAAGSDKTQVDV